MTTLKCPECQKELFCEGKLACACGYEINLLDDAVITDIEDFVHEVAQTPKRKPKREGWMQQIKPLRSGRKSR